eukprot:COSAG02_NODE_52128_length_309_cov_2.195238_1_plen_31_part_01
MYDQIVVHLEFRLHHSLDSSAPGASILLPRI